MRMNKGILFVVSFISDPENAVRYWAGDEGRLFTENLRNHGIKHDLYVQYCITLEDCDLTWADRMHSATLVQVSAVVDRTLEDVEAVLFLSDSMDAVSLLAKKEGCLPFLLSEGCRPDFESDKFIKIDMLSRLGPYFEGPMPHHLFLSIRKRPEEYRVQIEPRTERIRKQRETVGGVYIFGANIVGRQVHGECLKAGIRVFGFVDNDPAKQKTTFFQLPVVGPSALDPNRDVVILASGNHSHTIYLQLKGMHFEYIQNLSEFFFAVNCRTQPEMFFHDDLWSNRVRYHTLYLLLADAISRKVLENIIEHRQSLKLAPLARICDRENAQWFDRAFFVPGTDHVFVDGGGFDGDTARRFIDISGHKYRAVHVFELDPSLSRQAALNLAGFERVHVYNLGLSKGKGTLLFNQTGLTDGRLSSENGVPVETDSIDHMIDTTITFIKIDVEGAEEDAITGAADHIRNDVPMLAVAVYHKAEDLWSVPRLIMKHHDAYSFYLRHYTQVSYETVLYGLSRDPKTS